ncbi:MAG TPA: hypothetical protein VGS07_16490 [Thermoanaerobaculia bacterium]|jgi:hypothetical protein|nr:hypothetical protein [Thermoanaerobaculia bacterium]
MKWPSKTERERWEIGEFLDIYRRLPHGLDLELMEERDKPDFFVQEVGGNRRFGVEVTSVYLNDRSVPDAHMNDSFDWLNLQCDREQLELYESRLAQAVGEKVALAKREYDTRYPLLLSVYVNEYISKFITKDRWYKFRQDHNVLLGNTDPFIEVLFWNLPNNGAFSICS